LRAAAPARARPAGRRTHLPRHPRRVSGPATPRAAATRAPGTPGVLARLRALPEHPLLDRLLRGRAWIWLIGAALMGIVAMQVSLLKLNTGISRAVQATTTLERANVQLESEIARLGSNERISRVASERGMIAPPAGSVVYVDARPEVDATRAAQRMGTPSAAALAVSEAPPVPAAPEPGQVAPVVPAEPDAGVVAAPTPGQG
jgi:cell division protein FtsL